MLDGTKGTLGCYLEDLPRGLLDEERRWNSLKATQDVHFIPAVHAHTLSLHPRQHRSYPPAISTPNTSSTLPTDGRPISLRRCGKRLFSWLGTRSLVLYPGVFEDRWEYLTQQPPAHTTLDEKPHAGFMFGGGVEMAPHPSLTLSDVGRQSMSIFESWHTLVWHWRITGNGGEMAGRRVGRQGR
ncbi:uncharacterized protein ARMOST_06422 [Armillaria ostoyae]|uniref:Uncharacterized protein n=1 Tax=Armillaria ostoyae TaxID=47428 RepID=A0A284R2X2_ARMOS|nr:uncharacterized protein ARMOST_06422 [Armillaria ostoyae]